MIDYNRLSKKKLIEMIEAKNKQEVKQEPKLEHRWEIEYNDNNPRDLFLSREGYSLQVANDNMIHINHKERMELELIPLHRVKRIFAKSTEIEDFEVL